MKKWVVMFSLLLAACGASPTPQVIVVTATPNPATSTPMATATPTEVPTLTPTATFTPEPTPDMRVVDKNPHDLILSTDELPPDGRFYLVSESPGRNSEMISGWGADEGARYLEESGRIDGWSKDYLRGTRTVRVPDYLGLNVVIYSKPALGWWDAVSNELGDCSTFKRYTGKTATRLPDLDLKERSVMCVTPVMQSSGKNMLYYEIWAGYRNVDIQVWGYGIEGSFDADWLVNIARIQLQKIEGYPLSETVTYSP